MLYVYFVSYFLIEPEAGKWSFGRIEIRVDKEIKRISDVAAIEKVINADNPGFSACVQNFQLLRTEKSVEK